MSACVWCREPLPTLQRLPSCPHCAKELTDRTGAPLRAIDLDFEAILAAADASTLEWTKRGAWLALALGVLSQIPLVSPFAILVLLLAQPFWGRFLVARPYVRHFGAVRRFVTRWITRLTVILFVMPAYTSLAVPFLGLLTAPLIFGGTCWALRAYFRFHFLREHRREGVTFGEKVFLVVCVLVFVFLIILFGVLVWLGVSLLPAGIPR